MRLIPLLRAAHFNCYLSVLRDHGTPVSHSLHRAGLPGSPEESPEAFLSMLRVLDCVAANGGAGGAMELGFLAAQRATLGGLRAEYQRALITAPSGLARLEAFFRFGRREDTGVRTGIHPEGTSLRVVCESPGFERHPALVSTEWMNLLAIVSIVRSVAGESWYPEEMTFISHLEPHDAARAAFPNTKMLASRAHTSVLVPQDVLARPCHAPNPPEAAADVDPMAPDEAPDPLNLIREMVKPYLREGPLHVSELAGLLGTSERTLQRHLGEMGASYSRILAEARYQVACDMLEKDDMAIVEVASAAGYQNPTHFSRAFRKLAGLSPTEYRNSALTRM